MGRPRVTAQWDGVGWGVGGGVCVCVWGEGVGGEGICSVSGQFSVAGSSPAVCQCASAWKKRGSLCIWGVVWALGGEGG